MMSVKCDECGESISEDGDPHGCDFCHKDLCDDCVLFWRDEEIGDDGKCCGQCASDSQKEVPHEQDD